MQGFVFVVAGRLLLCCGLAFACLQLLPSGAPAYFYHAAAGA